MESDPNTGDLTLFYLANDEKAIHSGHLKSGRKVSKSRFSSTIQKSLKLEVASTKENLEIPSSIKYSDTNQASSKISREIVIYFSDYWVQFYEKCTKTREYYLNEPIVFAYSEKSKTDRATKKDNITKPSLYFRIGQRNSRDALFCV